MRKIITTIFAIVLSLGAWAQQNDTMFVHTNKFIHEFATQEVDSIIFKRTQARMTPPKDTVFILDTAQAVRQEIHDLVSGVEPFPVATEFSREQIIHDTSWTERFNTPRANASPSPSLSLSRKSLDECFVYNVNWRCVTTEISASRNPDDFVMFNPLASVLWPGNLVQGSSLVSGLPTSIPVTKRQPGTISLAIVTQGSAGAPMYRTVDRMSFSQVNQAMNDILSGFPGQGSARYSFEMDIIRSAEELEFKLNTSFAGFGARVRAGFNTNFSSTESVALVRLHQAYFTMVYDDPAGLDGVFTPDITVNDLRNYTGDGNPITYISSVTYGRIYYLLFESSASAEDLSAALSASWGGWGVNLNAETEYKTRQTLSQTRARVFQLGGGAEGGITAGMSNDFDKIREFLEAGINFNAQNVGEPISYTVKYLKNAQVVRMNNTMEFTVQNCTPDITETECPEPPQFTTNVVTEFSSTMAIVGGNIAIAGVPAYTERGVVYSTLQNPNLLNGTAVVVDGSGTGNFRTTLSGLSPRTT
jgi:hypothetical protein